MLHKIDSLFSIESLGNVFDRVFSPDFDYKGERHDYMEFVYVVSGRAAGDVILFQNHRAISVYREVT